MSEIAMFDSSVLLDQFRTGRHAERFGRLDVPIRNSAVVLAELWRGATSVEERELVLELEEDYPVLTPSTEQWIDSGQILAHLRARHGFEPAKLRDLHFDVLIALTAQSHGARLITSNRADFELIREYRDFKLEVW
ncbi:type II toxin-antitoxin system VapC family toxin [Occallatibacter riparius]|uniref:Type II toxin-antitoxin system VapC family toxin n=1 Tax=Occallatibacter riparius TaxID=1002689 RepID=A0A9J7BQ55_9BACT|nr:type II toxin-antitoxin system VapC family toxin [Occallatibacter riparius]UWZ84832.1 type II toxin-antitoxin system VapC family toxin [Occallatibacter riparius]